ncbi:MAG: hypothetical protein PHP00_15395 [Thiotrichaceae bacterium]|nr:hypothetical protein [Thiotrichaceae bacterium]
MQSFSRFHAPASLTATPTGGSTFAGWSCLGTAGYSYSTGNQIGGFSMPAEDVTCTVTLNGGPPPVNASVESNLALALTVLGITAIAGFKKWRNKKA